MSRPVAHRLVMDTAIGMAQELYEMAAKDNDFYRVFKNRGRFVKMMIPQLLDQARRQLAEMLGREETPETLKAQIYEAILMDRALQGADVQSVH